MKMVEPESDSVSVHELDKQMEVISQTRAFNIPYVYISADRLITHVT